MISHTLKIDNNDNNIINNLTGHTLHVAIFKTGENMAVIPTSLLALFLGFLQIKHSFCTYYLELNRDWNTICPESGCKFQRIGIYY